ncbi:hypothetical protein, partial [Confluentibacter sediminis]|uniref:hypothetical protein n=1 Tax=Confluentibacter sediminis TaxID=2219045 RepID=UPI001C7324BE
EDFYKQKLIWIELADKGRFALDDSDNFMTLNGTYILTGKDLEYLCCILNNPVISWDFNTFCISSGVGTNQWRELYVRNLLIPCIPKDSQKLFFKLLHDITYLEKENKSSVILQKELNQMVYDLLQLTFEEINFIESQ